jgi:transmembrane sensor
LEHPIWIGSDMDEATRQSSEWIARLNADDVSNDDRARFEAWRDSNPHHALAYEELHSTWLWLTAPGSSGRRFALHGKSNNEVNT